MINKPQNSNKENDEENEPLTRLLKYIFWIVIFWLVSGVVVYYAFGDKAGTVGDMFGGVNALFSGLAFAGLIYTIFLQRKELALQRSEISKSTKELEGQKDLMDLQNFENKFFQLLNLHHEIVKTSHQGRGLFQNISTAIFNQVPVPTENVPLDLLNNAYMILYRRNNAELGHYFRNLYHIVKFVDTSFQLRDEETRYSYVRILRAQLSTYEIMLLAYNGLSKHGKEFKPLIEKYKLLKNLDFHEPYLISKNLLFEQYPHTLEAYRELTS
ncbi:putative phage abortive infection protein [Paenibacillus chitinolyticus]|uniref:putative phage abortive infection protein n=1 Tax=Paenibacillus chitinolyticus TaxID=79263 RepID=UPI002DBE12E1|nr:putative phage abortive infection protein [Paenibacillus chitinolyticus]MEC0248888.1 putative phage abortive infection protein [Paenibacillus chitinolyticus]